MDEIYFRKLTTILILAVLLVLSFFLLKPLLLAVITGFILAFIFSPVYNLLNRLIKSKGITAGILCFVLLSLIILPLWFFTPTLIQESIKLYAMSQNLDLVTPLKSIFPSFFASQEFSQEVASIIHSSITTLANSLVNYFSDIILNFPAVIAQILVVFFTFFYALRDKDDITGYIKSLLPFSKEIEKKLFESTKDITFSVLYGQVVIGIIQGLILGVGFFVFGISNAFLLTILAILAGILPIIGPLFIGIPVAVLLLIGGNPVSAYGILIFSLISSQSDHFLRPLLVSKRTKLHTALVLVGMIGGFFLFGILGFVLGPLILAYLIIIVETYRNKTVPDVLIQEPDKKK
jgi:predicted PurR-regulated permease PerM